MKKVKLDLKNQSVPNKAVFALGIAKALTGNAHFSSPLPTVAELTAAAKALQLAHQKSLGGGKHNTTSMNLREQELDKLLRRIAAYVENIAAGDEEKINSAALTVAKRGGAPQLPDAPQNLRIDDGAQSGSIIVKWKLVKNTRAYLIYSFISDDVNSPDYDKNYHFFDACTTTSFTIKGLTPITRIWIKVQALSPAGKSGFSDPATLIVR